MTCHTATLVHCFELSETLSLPANASAELRAVARSASLRLNNAAGRVLLSTANGVQCQETIITYA
jgi:hypothetical protein